MNQKKYGPTWAFRMMSLIHDNPIRRRFSNPYKRLQDAGILEGKTVLEIGCGPGFFTIPCSKMVGSDGLVYALDIHPLAIKRVKRKIKENSLNNITLIEANASDTGLPDQSIDLAFFFGVPRLLRNETLFKTVLLELQRVLRHKGIISIKSSKKSLINLLKQYSFSFVKERKGILIFSKSSK